MGLQPQVRDAIACNALEKARGVGVRASPQRRRDASARRGGTCCSTPITTARRRARRGRRRRRGRDVARGGVDPEGERLRRPVSFLFNEGEELGLVGARAFLADPLAGKVDSLVNLEARGVTGPVMMFETSVPTAPRSPLFARR